MGKLYVPYIKAAVSLWCRCLGIGHREFYPSHALAEGGSLNPRGKESLVLFTGGKPVRDYVFNE